MDRPWRILHLEDDPDFSELVRSLLKGEGVEAELVVVSTREQFEAALESGEYDVILADYLLPAYNGMEALRLARSKRPETPFLLVSGTIGEQAAIESLKNGATDYVLKLVPERLVPTVRRAVQEAEERRQRKKIETELLRRETHLRQSEQQYRLIFDNNPTPMWVFDHQTLRFLEVNDAAVQHYGFSREEFLAMTISELRPEKDGPALVEYLHQLTTHDETHGRMGFAGIWRHRKKNGSLIDVEIKWCPITFRGRTASLTMANDVTERRRVEHRDAALSMLGQHLSSATSAADAARIIKAAADDLFAWDAFTLDLYSVEEDMVLPILNMDTDREGRRFEIAVGGQKKPPSRMARRIIEQGAELILRQEPLRMPDDVLPIGDTTRPSASLALAPIRNRTKVIGILSIQSYRLAAYTGHDLNALQMLADHCGGALERIRAEQALRSSELLFHSVWENSVDGMRLTDGQGTIVAVNEAFCKLVGLTRNALEGQALTVIYDEAEHPEQMRAAYRERFGQRTIGRHTEQQLKLRNGQVLTLATTNSFVELQGGAPLLLGLFRDVTGQKQLEAQLRQSQKMEAIGQLAGGVAHDFNNILTVIRGHAALLQAADNLPPAGARSAQQIVQAADRAAALTRQLLTFSRRQVMQPRRLDINEVVGNMSKMLGRLLREDIAVQLYYSPEPALVHADASMMEQVLLNLAVNARDAMPSGGLLTIRVGQRQLDVSRVTPEGEMPPGKYVCFAVADTGEGISSENLPRIFEPFFTTKEVGKGTGLGLATVYGIVRQHQGWIEVESRLGQGTTFRVFLPWRGDGVDSQSATAQERPVRGGKETILVVEDEAPVRDLVCDLLGGQGYRILQAESGAKALELWNRCDEKVDLLLTDLVMPDRLNGRELAEKLQAQQPHLKVLFTSGYSAEVVGKDFVLRSGLNYLQKPYSPDKLALAVRDCLDAVR